MSNESLATWSPYGGNVTLSPELKWKSPLFGTGEIMSTNFFGIKRPVGVLRGWSSVSDGGERPLHGEIGAQAEGTFWSVDEAGDKESCDTWDSDLS